MQVRVFRNLTAGPKGKAPVYSIQAREPGKGWRTVAHARHVCVTGVEFKVNKAGVARIRGTGKKTVVATVNGTLEHWSGVLRAAGVDLALAPFLDRKRYESAEFPDAERETWFRPVRFNPFQTDTFQADGKPALRASTAWIGGPGVLAANPA